jgi:signal transduction histidine kinase
MRRELQGRPLVEAYAADLSHELKNPVAAIRASAEVLRDGAGDEPEQAAHFLARILEATSRIEALLGDLLSLARLEARGVQDATLVDLRAQAQAAAQTVRDRGADVKLSFQGNTTVRGDAAWLRCAVENLLDNAQVHGTPERPIRATISREGDEVRISIENEGAVDGHVHKRLFRRFVTTRAHDGGTGLGLAIVRAIAEAHGGRAACAEPGPPEVRFEVWLPGA